MTEPKHTFVIRYKSGTEVTVRSDTLRVVWDTNVGRAVRMEWDNMQPEPLAMGMRNVESVWQVD